MMKPINSKERTKMFWQFFFIFVALCIVPMALIFYTYHVTPEKMDAIDQQKLQNYNDFDRGQKLLTKKLSDIDSNINLLTSGATVDVTYTSNLIAKDIQNIPLDNEIF